MRHAVDQSRPPRLSPRAHGASHWTGRQRRVAARRAPHLAKRALLGLALALVWVGVSGLAWGQTEPTLSVTSSLSGAEDGSVDLFGATTVSAPDSNTMEAVVTVTAGSGVIDSGLISGTSVSSQGDRSDINGFLDDLTFVPDPDWAGDATVELKVESDYLTRNDGDVTTETITVTIASINDAPAGSDATISIDEEQAYTIGAGDFGFADPSDGPPDALASVDIVGLPADGTLTIDGEPATSAATVTEAQLNANELVFTPDDDDFGDGYASLAFRVRDDGGTANGGVDLDPTANTLTFDVANLNDAPVAKDTNETVDKNGSLTFDLSVPEDADDVDGSADVTGFRIESVPSSGTVTLDSDGSEVSDGDVLSVPATLTYAPATNVTGDVALTFYAVDAASVDSALGTVTITIQQVNLAPTLTVPGPQATDEDTLVTIGGISVSDPDPSVDATVTLSASNGTIVVADDDATGGTVVSGSGSATTTLTGSITEIDVTLGATSAVSYTPDADVNGTDTLTVTLNDGGIHQNDDPSDPQLAAPQEVSDTIDVTIDPIPDRPVTGDAVLPAVDEDTSSPSGETVTALLSGYDDADDDALAGVAISDNAATPPARARGSTRSTAAPSGATCRPT